MISATLMQENLREEHARLSKIILQYGCHVSTSDVDGANQDSIQINFEYNVDMGLII